MRLDLCFWDTYYYSFNSTAVTLCLNATTSITFNTTEKIMTDISTDDDDDNNNENDNDNNNNNNNNWKLI